MALGFIEGFSDFDGLTDSALRKHPQVKAAEYLDAFKIFAPDSFVRTDLWMEMSEKTRDRAWSQSLCPTASCFEDTVWRGS